MLLRARGPVVAVLAALVLGSSACTGGGGGDPDSAASSTSPSSAGSASPQTTESSRPVPRPALGACYRMSLRQAMRASNGSPSVSCRKPHTAQTIHVGRLDLSPGGRQLRVDAPAVQRQPAAVCPVRLRRYVGGTTDVRRRSRFEVVWFTPTLQQAQRGARWFRCDAVAVLDDRRLQRLPPGSRLRGVLDRPGALATYGLCGTAQPGSARFRRVACARPHRWEAVSTIDLAGRKYPGAARVRAAGDKTCADRVQARSGGALQFSYGWEWPTRAQWAAGQHFGYCWAPGGA